MPDAGNYTHIDTFESNKGKAMKFGAPYEHKYNDNPGPGAYEETGAVKHHEASVQIGQEKRANIWEQ